VVLVGGQHSLKKADLHALGKKESGALSEDDSTRRSWGKTWSAQRKKGERAMVTGGEAGKKKTNEGTKGKPWGKKFKTDDKPIEPGETAPKRRFQG